MIRRYNYTSRLAIDRDRIKIDIQDEEETMTFDATIDVSGLNLPPDADLVLVANHNRKAARFNFGRVGAIVHPADRSLPGIEGQPRFRLLVVEPGDSGRLIAAADDIRAQKGESNGIQSLLWTKITDLDGIIWRLEFSETENPTLLLNRAIPNIRESIRTDNKFRALIIPEIFRAILNRMVHVERYDPSDETPPWVQWSRVISDFQDKEIPLVTDHESRMDADEWIEDTVTLFTRARFNAPQVYQSA